MPYTGIPDNQLFPLQWYLRLIKAPEAWWFLHNLTPSTILFGAEGDLTFGHSKIIVAVLDNGVETIGSKNAVHLAFSGVVAGNLEKYVGSFNFDTPKTPDPTDGNKLKYMDNTNDKILGSHGVLCAGLVLAKPIFDTEYPTGGGIIGVAGNCRLVGIIANYDTALKNGALWAANLGLESNANFVSLYKKLPLSAQYRIPTGEQTDIISLSLIGVMSDLRDHGYWLTIFGRKGRGLISVAAAGNSRDKDVMDTQMLSDSRRFLIVGATGIADSDSGNFETETVASYSTIGKKLSICAPGGDTEVTKSDHLILTTTTLDAGTVDFSTDVFTIEITRITNLVYSTSLPVMGLFSGQYVSVGSGPSGSFETRRIKNINVSTGRITLEKKFTNPSGLLNLNSPIDATIPYQFSLVQSTQVAPNSITITDPSARGLADGQEVFIMSLNTGEYATILSVVNNLITFDDDLSSLYPANSLIIAGPLFRKLKTPTKTKEGAFLYPLVREVQGDPDIASVQGLYIGQKVYCPYKNEYAPISKIFPDTNQVEFFRLDDSWSGLLIETVGGGEYDSEFSGTSASTPIVAGGAALVLSANMQLNWIEVFHILQSSAFKVDLSAQGEGKWEDEHGDKLFRGFANIFFENAAPTTLSSQAYLGNQTIDVLNASNFSKGCSIRIGGAISFQYAVVLHVSGNTVTLDRPLNKNFNLSAPVKIGLSPFHSNFYGAGRIDLEAAVKMAANWDVNARDLWIRDFIGDSGAPHGSQLLIDSPDIWVRVTNPTTDDYHAIETVDANPPPHCFPRPNQNAWVYVRVRNRGSLPSLQGMELVITVTQSNDPAQGPIQFKFPDRWHGPIIPGTFLFLEQTTYLTPNDTGKTLLNQFDSVLYESSAGFAFAENPSAPNDGFEKPHLLPSIQNGWEHIAIFPWPGKYIPSKKDRLNRVFIKAHIAPFDGDDSVAGDQVYNNNNLSYKEIFFLEAVLRDSSSSEVLEKINVDTIGTINIQPFELSLFHVELLEINNIIIQVKATFSDNTPPEIATFSYVSSTWVTSNTYPWLQILPPILSGSQSQQRQEFTTFPGNLLVSHLHAKVTFDVTIPDLGGDYIDTFEVNVKADAPRNAAGIAPKLQDIYSFTDMDLLPTQLAAKAFGPQSTKDFNTGSLFTGATGAPAKMKAYAVCAGQAFLQKVTGTNQLNLILEPTQALETSYGRVKYLVYKGLRQDSFLNANDSVLNNVPANNNQLLNRMWEVRIASNNEAVPPTNHLLLADDFGIDLSNQQSANTPLSAMFLQLACQPITAGWHIGDFDMGGGTSYGLEIIVDGPYHEPVLGDVRTLVNQVTIDYSNSNRPQYPTAEDDIAYKLQREKVLSYLDPAAFYGMMGAFVVGDQKFYHVKKNSGDLLMLDVAMVYDNMVDYFATKGNIYVDIRNEVGHSLNFFGSYSDLTPQRLAQINFLDPTNTVQQLAYHTMGWPLLTLTTSDFLPEAFSTLLHLQIALPEGDNGAPMLYYSGCSPFESFPTQVKRFKIPTLSGGYTSMIDLGILNHYASPSPVPMPTALKLAFCRRYAQPQVMPPGFPYARPLKNDLMDLLLSPADIALPTHVAGSTSWDTRDDLRYNGWTSLQTGFDFTLRTGRIKDDAGEIAFAFVQGPAELQGGTSDVIKHLSIDKNKGQAKADTFLRLLSEQGLIRVSETTIMALPLSVTCLRILSAADNYSVNLLDRSADDLMMVAYANAELAAIANASAVFLPGSTTYFVARNHEMLADSVGQPYFKMELWVQGIIYNTGSFGYDLDIVNTNLILYSLDQRNYFTAAYAASITPLLPFHA